MRQTRTWGARGFTLVEVLVALFVMATMAAMAWRGIDAVLASRDAGRASIDRTSLLSTVLAQWELDLQSLQDDAGVPTLSFDGRTLRLVRRTEGGLQLVAWSLEGTQWLRWAAPPTAQADALHDAWMRSQQLQAADPGQLALLDGVDSLQLYFYRGNAWSNAQSSADLAAPAPEDGASAAARGREALPSGVRLVLQLGGHSLTRDVLVAAGT
ncbi:MAG TPA: type II secretion system protein GspJ [Rubrivivax sp.]|nr:prepilin-type N-terminal cleavage/methylation domain-containing protein [Burkholderiales bacterium]HNU09955.1 type II secretion system protein GspJ [Rubrivivax sp.]